MPPVSWGVSPAVEAAARFLWSANLASVSCGVSLCPGGRSTVRLVRECSRTGVAVALKRAIFVAAEDTLPVATLFVGGMSQKVTVTA